MDMALENGPVDQIRVGDLVHKLLEDNAGLHPDLHEHPVQIGGRERSSRPTPLGLEEACVVDERTGQAGGRPDAVPQPVRSSGHLAGRTAPPRSTVGNVPRWRRLRQLGKDVDGLALNEPGELVAEDQKVGRVADHDATTALALVLQRELTRLIPVLDDRLVDLACDHERELDIPTLVLDGPPHLPRRVTPTDVSPATGDCPHRRPCAHGADQSATTLVHATIGKNTAPS